MSTDSTARISQALDRLEAAIGKAAASCSSLAEYDERLDLRMRSYKEVVARQRILVAELSTASSRRDWREVSRLSQLIQAASFMIKMDARYIIDALESRRDRKRTPTE